MAMHNNGGESTFMQRKSEQLTRNGPPILKGSTRRGALKKIEEGMSTNRQGNNWMLHVVWHKPWEHLSYALGRWKHLLRYTNHPTSTVAPKTNSPYDLIGCIQHNPFYTPPLFSPCALHNLATRGRGAEVPLRGALPKAIDFLAYTSRVGKFVSPHVSTPKMLRLVGTNFVPLWRPLGVGLWSGIDFSPVWGS